ncbi:MAG: hypothetical protein MK212_00110 [Saprospiraceae bacterium]|nr:hypothetical protein [Saprospiraceae bacterium]
MLWILISCLLTCQCKNIELGEYTNNPNGKTTTEKLVLNIDGTFFYKQTGGLRSKESIGEWQKVNRNTIILNSKVKNLNEIELSVTERKDGKKNHLTLRVLDFRGVKLPFTDVIVNDTIVYTINNDTSSVYSLPFREKIQTLKIGYSSTESRVYKVSNQDANFFDIVYEIPFVHQYSYMIFDNEPIRVRKKKLLLRDIELEKKQKSGMLRD